MELVKRLLTLKEHLSGDIRVLEHIKLDEKGSFISVQCSGAHYCLPRKTIDLKFYTHFEVLLNTDFDKIPNKWLEEYNDGSNELFAMVPKQEIEEFIKNFK